VEQWQLVGLITRRSQVRILAPLLDANRRPSGLRFLVCLEGYSREWEQHVNEIPFEEEYMDILQNIETAIHSIHLENPALTDYDVDHALEFLFRAYRNEARGQTSTPPRNASSLQVYEAARGACEVRLGRAPIPPNLKKLGDGEFEPVPIEIILQALKRIRKSISLWTKEGGRQGYLDYITQFIA
jgi:hypothetical protein